ncbi:hypothetical protein DH2020_036258 [Rehmannia glutinosa]|uniref:Transferring glycosyl group transferase n=1 Tax=Rehmannia glutinosa TaxID=99300 RepID=A0ABR0V6M2_REHGL
MKVAQSNSEKFIWDSTRPPPPAAAASQSKAAPKPMVMVWLILFISATYLVYTIKLLSSSHNTCEVDIFSARHFSLHKPSNETIPPPRNPTKQTLRFSNLGQKFPEKNRTGLEHIVFGIAASAKLWDKRKEYIKLWFKPEKRMKGTVWLDKPVKIHKNETKSLPQLRISGNTSHFAYKNKKGHHSAIRISRIVSETLRLGETENVRWFVMGDDDTVFVTDNLVRILNKYDHNQYYYIGSLSESHLQNIYFSYGMAYGGGGFAISYPLAKALDKMQDRCIQRYPGLYGSDDRMQACMAELGVPLTKELVYSWWMPIQYDVHGNLFGLLAAHPVTPLVSLHHLDVVEPIFPNVTQLQALQRLKIPMQLDSAGLMQQSICYDETNGWTMSVSWGFTVQIFRGVLSPREIEMPSRTFLNWYKRADYKAYAFNTRSVMRNPCQKPIVFYLSRARMESNTNKTVSEYVQHRVPNPECKWKMADPADVDRVEVYKKPDPHLWDRCFQVDRDDESYDKIS